MARSIPISTTTSQRRYTTLAINIYCQKFAINGLLTNVEILIHPGSLGKEMNALCKCTAFMCHGSHPGRVCTGATSSGTIDTRV
jgi:hypothetical protein